MIALGKIGDKRALADLANLQRTGEQGAAADVATGICLLGVNCSSHLGYLQKVLTFADDNPGYQELVSGRGVGSGGRSPSTAMPTRWPILFDTGIPSADPIRAPLALAVGKVALRNTPLMLQGLQAKKDVAGALSAPRRGLRHA